jgi:hypothetical protein
MMYERRLPARHPCRQGFGQCCGSGPFWSAPDPDPDIWDQIKFLEPSFAREKNSRRNLAENLFRSGSEAGSGRFQKSDPDPDKKCLDPQVWLWRT